MPKKNERANKTNEKEALKGTASQKGAAKQLDEKSISSVAGGYTYRDSDDCDVEVRCPECGSSKYCHVGGGFCRCSACCYENGD